MWSFFRFPTRGLANVITISLLGGIFFTSFQPAGALEVAGVVISGVKVSGGSGHTFDEYVEIYNQGSAPVDISGWRLVKLTKSASSTAYTDLGEALPTSTVILPHTYWLAAHAQSLDIGAAEVDWQYQASSLADDNTVVLLDKTDTVVDMLGWGAAKNFLGTAAEGPGTLGLQRRVGDDGFAVHTKNNANDFVKSTLAPHRRTDVVLTMAEASSTPNSSTDEESNEGVAIATTTVLVENMVESLTGMPTASSSESALESAEEIQPQIIITEFLPRPGIGQTEFVELYNAGALSTDLSDWKLMDTGGSVTAVSGTLAVGDFLVVWSPKGALNNVGDSVSLYNSQDEIVDSVTYGDEAAIEIPAVGHSVIRPFTDGSWRAWEETTVITPGLANVQGQAVQDAQVIEDGAATGAAGAAVTVRNTDTKVVKINEIFTNPLGDDTAGEFIELYNRGSMTIDLHKWRLQVNEQEYIFAPQAVAAGAWLVLSRAATNLVLPNQGIVIIKLINANGVEQDRVTYRGPATEGAAFIVVDGWGWQWTRQVTLGSANEWIRPNRPPHAEISGPEVVEVGELVQWHSDNTYDPDHDGLQYSWELGDDQVGTGANVQTVYEKSGKYRVRLVVKDATGEEDSAEQTVVVRSPPVVLAAVGGGGGRGDASSTAKNVGATKKTNKPTSKVVAKTRSTSASRSTAKKATTDSGTEVVVRGELTGGKGRNWRLDDGTDEMAIMLPQGKSPLGAVWKVGSHWQIRGRQKHTDTGATVTVQSWKDITLIKEAQESVESATTRTGAGFTWWSGIILFGLGGSIIMWQRRRRIKNIFGSVSTKYV